MSGQAGPASFGKLALQWAGVSARALGWRPDDFWRATPAELVAALSSPLDAGSAPPDRSEITRMMERDNERSS